MFGVVAYRSGAVPAMVRHLHCNDLLAASAFPRLGRTLTHLDRDPMCQERRMRYRDIEYTVVQGIERQLWKWEVEAIHLRGQDATKSEAVREAERAIDRALAPKKLRPIPPTREH